MTERETHRKNAMAALRTRAAFGVHFAAAGLAFLTQCSGLAAEPAEKSNQERAECSGSSGPAQFADLPPEEHDLRFYASLWNEDDTGSHDRSDDGATQATPAAALQPEARELQRLSDEDRRRLGFLKAAAEYRWVQSDRSGRVLLETPLVAAPGDAVGQPRVRHMYTPYLTRYVGILRCKGTVCEVGPTRPGLFAGSGEYEPEQKARCLDFYLAPPLVRSGYYEYRPHPGKRFYNRARPLPETDRIEERHLYFDPLKLLLRFSIKDPKNGSYGYSSQRSRIGSQIQVEIAANGFLERIVWEKDAEQRFFTDRAEFRSALLRTMHGVMPQERVRIILVYDPFVQQQVYLQHNPAFL